MRRDGQYAYYRLRSEVVQAYVATLETRMRVSIPRGTAVKRGALRK
jgi:hypothetical protein